VVRRRALVTAAAMRPGEAGEIVAVEAPDPDSSRRLFAVGLVPGVRLTLVQRFPAYVVKAGETTVALDREMAESIWVALGKGC